jgi:pimeloyl-ACP methyl ester carboxylesterase
MKDLVITHHSITRSGTTLHYWLTGPVSRPLVVFTHGGGMDHHMFEEQLTLVAREYRVLLWDMHGHGQSQPMGMEGIFSLPTMVDDVLAIVDQEGYQQACFVGHSFGAYLPQELAFRYPERVTALVVIGGACLTQGLPPGLGEALQAEQTPLAGREFKSFLAEIAGIQPRVKAYAKAACAPVTEETWLALTKAIPGFFHDDVDYRFLMPFLLTHGEQDVLTTGKQEAEWARRESRCRYVVIPQAGHHAHQDNSEFFNAVLLDFLSQHVPVTGETASPLA